MRPNRTRMTFNPTLKKDDDIASLAKLVIVICRSHRISLTKRFVIEGYTKLLSDDHKVSSSDGSNRRFLLFILVLTCTIG